jgi:hypothetical protein
MKKKTYITPAIAVVRCTTATLLNTSTVTTSISNLIDDTPPGYGGIDDGTNPPSSRVLDDFLDADDIDF